MFLSDKPIHFFEGWRGLNDEKKDYVYRAKTDSVI
jgi:hypothetical protein